MREAAEAAGFSMATLVIIFVIEVLFMVYLWGVVRSCYLALKKGINPRPPTVPPLETMTSTRAWGETVD